MPMDVQQFEKIRARAEMDAIRIVKEAIISFERPEIEAREVAEWTQMTDEQKATMFQRLGAQKYTDYVTHMEELTARRQRGR